MTTVVEYDDLNVGDVIHVVSADDGTVSTYHGTVTKLRDDSFQEVELDDDFTFEIDGDVIILVKKAVPSVVEELPYLFVKYPVGTLVRGRFPESELCRNWVAEPGGKFRSITTDALYDQGELLVTEVLWIR